MSEIKYVPVPQAAEVTKKEKEDAMGSYLMMFATYAMGLPLPLINLIAAGIYYLINRKSSRFVKFHALQSLLSQVVISIANATLLAWTIFLLVEQRSFSNVFFGYLFLVIILNLMYTIISIIGSIKANKGKMYYFLFFGKLAYHWSFREKPEETKQEVENLPPF